MYITWWLMQTFLLWEIKFLLIMVNAKINFYLVMLIDIQNFIPAKHVLLILNSFNILVNICVNTSHSDFRTES